jgi:hypothetical protein
MQEIEGQLWGLLIWGLLAVGTPIALFRFLIARGRKRPVPVLARDDSALRSALGTRRCDLCKKGCQLTAPRCGRGRELRDALIKGHVQR